MTTTIVLILVVLNLVLLILGLAAWRLFRSDPNPTVSDPLGVPRVARVSGIVGTLSDGSGSGQPGAAKSIVATTAAQASSDAPREASSGSSSTRPSAAAASAEDADSNLALPGLFAIDTGAPDSLTQAADAAASTG